MYFVPFWISAQLPVNLGIGSFKQMLVPLKKFYLLFSSAMILDVIVVGSLKAFARRKRPPTKKSDYFKSIGPDKFSFPSGHASRAVLLATIFTQIYPLFEQGFLHLISSLLIWSWAAAVCFSRLVNGRHYVFDVTIGVVVGLLEGLAVSYLWMSTEKAVNILSFFSGEAPEI